MAVNGRFCRYWWTSLAISSARSMMFIGGNTGKAMIFDAAGNKVRTYTKKQYTSNNIIAVRKCLVYMQIFG